MITLGIFKSLFSLAFWLCVIYFGVKWLTGKDLIALLRKHIKSDDSISDSPKSETMHSERKNSTQSEPIDTNQELFDDNDDDDDVEGYDDDDDNDDDENEYGIVDKEEDEASITPVSEVYDRNSWNQDEVEIVVPEGVKMIADDTFSLWNDNIQSVTLPSTLFKIGKDAFRDCENLKTINLSSCDNLEEIGESAFSCCQNLTEIVIPDSVTSIGKDVFNGCTNLKKIVLPPSLKSIGESAFVGCENLEEVILPPELESIGSGAFRACQFKEIVIPDSVKNIGASAFAVNKQLIKATVGSSAKNYFDYDNQYSQPIFKDTPNLKELTFKSEVAEYTGAKTIIKVTFCDTVKELGKWALAQCAELEEVAIPDSVTKIGFYALGECENLSSVLLPDTIAEICKGAFSGTRIREIVFPRELRKLGSCIIENNNKIRKLDFSKVTKLKVIPENFIGDNTPKLKELILPVGVTNVEENIGGNLNKLFLPPTVEEVEDLHQTNLNIYCFSPEIEELALMVESIEDEEKACHLYVLPEYFETYKEKYKEEGISEKILTINVIPEELRHIYDK